MDYIDEGEVQYPAGFGMKDVVAWGSTGLVVRDKVSQTVIKKPFSVEQEPFVSREREIYERLGQRGSHRGLLRDYGSFENGIRLEYVPNGDIQRFQRRQGTPVDMQLELRWATQVAEALDFVHGTGVVHGDLRCQNIFLDEHLNARLGDFAGSSLDGSELLIGVPPSHESPGPVLSVQGDIFAFGSLVYEIMTGASPHKGLSECEIKALCEKGEFADTSSLGVVGDIIRKCWMGNYQGFEPLAHDLRRTISLSLHSSHQTCFSNTEQHCKSRQP
jgi:serine/threonine protein kinase